MLPRIQNRPSQRFLYPTLLALIFGLATAVIFIPIGLDFDGTSTSKEPSDSVERQSYFELGGKPKEDDSSSGKLLTAESAIDDIRTQITNIEEQVNSLQKTDQENWKTQADRIAIEVDQLNSAINALEKTLSNS